ncbi:MAG TPA: glycerophosphodiester phosphodiesterase [Acidimicrobiales bacterium]|nr:glycerophosphodiester phosphodiesterase [Acidimicrobiales bacterium]
MRPPLRRPIGFAHRGARSERRENTLEAFARALELGATGLESDAWLTADGVVVLDHDGVTGLRLRRRRIRDHVRRTLPPHIPALADLYGELGTDFELSLDIKDPAAFEAILEVAGRAGSAERLWLCEDDFARVTRRAPAAGSAHPVLSTHLEDLDRVVPGGVQGAAASLASAGASALNLHGSEWNAERVEVVHAAGLLAFGWDAQSEYHISRLVGLGVDGIYSDHVDRLMAVISEVAPKPGAS